jgi:hypothetical protein
MEVVTSAVDTAFYRCRSCRQSFTIGHEVQVGGRPRRQALKVSSASVLSNPCPGRDISPADTL